MSRAISIFLGCKKFSSLSDFADKPEASKCAKCRHRGRQNYYSRKQGEDPTTRKSTKTNPFAGGNGTVPFDQIPSNRLLNPLDIIGPNGVSSNLTAFSKPTHGLPPPQFHCNAFNGCNRVFPDKIGTTGDSGRHSSGSSNSRSSIECSTRNSLDSSDDDVLLRSLSNRMYFMSDDTAYRHSSSGNSSLGSAEFSLMTSPNLGNVVLHGSTPAAANLPGAHLSADALNFTWTTSHATSPRPPSQNTTLTISGTVIPSANQRLSSAKDMSQSRLSTPAAQLPHFGASPVPIAPASTFNTGAGYLTMIDTGLPCDITPLTSLSSPGGHSEDSSWKWDPSVNSLMNLASLSQCVLTTGSSPPVDVVGGENPMETSDLSSVSSALFTNGSSRRCSSRSSSSRRSSVQSSGPGSDRQTTGERQLDEGVPISSICHSRTPSLPTRMSKPPDSHDRQIYLHSRSMEAADTPNADVHGSPKDEATANQGESSFAVRGIAHRRNEIEANTTSAEKSIRYMEPPVSNPRRMSTRGTPTAAGDSAACSSSRPPSTRGRSSGVKSHFPVAEEGASGRKRPCPHHTDQQHTAAAEDNIMRVAIGDAKRLRMLSPVVHATCTSMTREGSEASSASIMSEYTSTEEKEEEDTPVISERVAALVGEASSTLKYSQGSAPETAAGDKKKPTRRACANATRARRPPPRASRIDGNK